MLIDHSTLPLSHGIYKSGTRKFTESSNSFKVFGAGAVFAMGLCLFAGGMVMKQQLLAAEGNPTTPAKPLFRPAPVPTPLPFDFHKESGNRWFVHASDVFILDKTLAVIENGGSLHCIPIARQDHTVGQASGYYYHDHRSDIGVQVIDGWLVECKEPCPYPK